MQNNIFQGRKKIEIRMAFSTNINQIVYLKKKFEQFLILDFSMRLYNVEAIIMAWNNKGIILVI